jgi:CBS domain-containing protein
VGDSVRDVMSEDLTSVEPGTSVTDAAKQMRESDIGAILVIEDEELRGLLTDRDIVVKVVAEGRDPDDVEVGDVASDELQTLEPDASLDDALRTMREGKVRRLPVVEDGKPVGIVSLGDVAAEREPDSALGEISEAPPQS